MIQQENYLHASPEQKRAIMHHKGPAQVLAGPGSGKTFTIVKRISYLIHDISIDPSAILVITFTKEAAREIRGRFIREQQQTKTSVMFGTFHSIFYHILKNINQFGQLSLITEKEKRKIIKNLLSDEFSNEQNKEDEISLLLSEISKMKNCEQGYHAYRYEGEAYSQEQLVHYYEGYDELLKVQGKIDFDDMILRCYEILSSKPDVLQKWQNAFEYIMVDEFQDCNGLQYKTLKLLSKQHNNLFVVGDDDQAIYGFRGAKPAIMREFLKDFPDTVQIILNINYRSNSDIIRCSNKVISQNKDRMIKQIISNHKTNETDLHHNHEANKTDVHTGYCRPVSVKRFHTPEEEYDYIISILKNRTEEELLHTAIIQRTNPEIMSLMVKLSKSNIPFTAKANGADPFSHSIALDFISYLDFSANYNRKNILRIMNKPIRYISRSAVSNFHTEEDLLAFYSGNHDMQISIKKFFTDCDIISKLSPYLAINYIRKGIGYDGHLSADSCQGQAESMLLLADFIQESARGFETREEWYDFMEQYRKTPSENQLNSSKGVSLLTMHAAKGLEFSCVIIPDINQGNIPSRKAMTEAETEEERRLFYVAMTRAKNELHLLSIASPNKVMSDFLRPILEK